MEATLRWSARVVGIAGTATGCCAALVVVADTILALVTTKKKNPWWFRKALVWMNESIRSVGLDDLFLVLMVICDF